MAKSKTFSPSTPGTPQEVEVERLPEVISEVVSTVPQVATEPVALAITAAPVGAPEEVQVVGNLVTVPMPVTEPVKPVTYDQAVLDSKANLSQRIKYLNACGATTSQIVKILKYNAKGGTLLYQHVRNVLLQYKKQG